MIKSSEFQTGFTRGLCQRFDAAVVTKPGTVKRYRLYSSAPSLLGNSFSNQLGSASVAAPT